MLDSCLKPKVNADLHFLDLVELLFLGCFCVCFFDNLIIFSFQSHFVEV